MRNGLKNAKENGRAGAQDEKGAKVEIKEAEQRGDGKTDGAEDDELMINDKA